MTRVVGDLFGRELERAPTRPIRASIEIAATPDVVFRALADPRELAAWLGDWPASQSPNVPPSDAATEAEHGSATSPSMSPAHPRAGAGWLVHVRAPDGTPGTVSGEFLHVVPPRSLTTTWSASWHRFTQDQVTFELVPIEVAGVPGTRVTVTHRGSGHLPLSEPTVASAPATERADDDTWATLLARLTVYVATRNALAPLGIASGDFAQAFDALHRRVVAIHQGESA